MDFRGIYQEVTNDLRRRGSKRDGGGVDKAFLYTFFVGTCIIKHHKLWNFHCVCYVGVMSCHLGIVYYVGHSLHHNAKNAIPFLISLLSSKSSCILTDNYLGHLHKGLLIRFS